MKDICEVVYEYLLANTQINSKIKGRLYPQMLPEDAPLPSIVYSPVLANYDSALQGDTGYVRQMIQFVCHDKTFGKARALSRLVKKALQDYKGNMGGLNIEAVFIKTDYAYNGNTSLKFSTDEYLSSIEFEIHYIEEQEEQ